MQLYSTNNPALRTSFKEAVFKGLPDDNGLYMPLEISKLPESFISELSTYSFQEISYFISKSILREAVPDSDLEKIINSAINFPVPIVRLDDETYVLELFHGPSLAFKDFGARFMAGVMSYFNSLEGHSKPLTILVATSGDTGGAVAAGFFNTPCIEVVVLYPSGKVSCLQEKQLTTFGHNITALEISGTFDDCQSLVKKAFLDRELTNRMRLSSANSINIARLIPQIFYYFEAYKQIGKTNLPIVFSVPSGNFGNLTAGIFAKRIGLPVHQLIAATNANEIVPIYLKTGVYTPRPSKQTLSNAMDVGAPSNFARMLDIYCSMWNNMRGEVLGYGFNDEQTRQAMQEVDMKYGYVMDPHGAIGYLALKEYRKQKKPCAGIAFETAHPAKFSEEVEQVLGRQIEVPQRLEAYRNKEKCAIPMTTNYEQFKEWLLTRR